MFLRFLPFTTFVALVLCFSLCSWSIRSVDAFVSPSYAVSSSHAVTEDTIFASRRIALVKRELHPDQAAELEACAYDLMRQAAATSSPSSQAMNRKEGGISMTMLQTSRVTGACQSMAQRPVAWCRRIVASAFHHNGNDGKP